MTVKNLVKSRKLRGLMMNSLRFLPDKLYIKLFYWAATGERLNLKNPQTYKEKLNWLKLHDIHPEYCDLADKIKVRKVVEEKLGEGYMFPLLGQWKRFDEIDFDELPDQFALKCNHDSGSTKVIRDKSALSKADIKKMKKHFDRRMRVDFFYAGREYPYKGIDRYIIAEPLMGSSENGTEESELRDYKFYCFNGVPKEMLIVSGRYTEKHNDYFDMDLNWLPYSKYRSPTCPQPPVSFEKMKEMAALLSQGIKQVRMDFYEVDGKPYFGEYTFFDGGGFGILRPLEDWDLKWGSWIDLDGPEVVRKN